MNRYKKANQGIHAPEELKQKVIQSAKPVRRPARWAALAAVLAVAIAAGVALWPGGNSLTASAAVVEAEYPDRVPYPDVNPLTGAMDEDAYAAWREENQARRELASGVDNESMASYYAATMAEFLGDNGGENAVYSPLNLYLALAMLAECTDGDSRGQILALLGVDDLDALRAQAQNLWRANYRDDGQTTSLLANSVWLDEALTYNEDTLNTLADTYYASSYRGEMGSEELNRALQSWLNDNTGGLLEEYAGQIETEPDTLLALASTIYFQASWADEFDESATAPRTFHAADGDRSTDFMHQSEMGNYYWGEDFSAVAKPFQNGGEMWLILPDEGVAPEELLAGDTLTSFLLAGYEWENQQYHQINLSMPRFDVEGEINLIGGLQELGVTDVFDPSQADFTPMLGEGVDAYVNQANHAARVRVDEEGCEGAAFTVIMAAEGAPAPGEEIDFVLDRPFLFAVTSQTGQLLFVGIVNRV